MKRRKLFRQTEPPHYTTLRDIIQKKANHIIIHNNNSGETACWRDLGAVDKVWQPYFDGGQGEEC